MTDFTKTVMIIETSSNVDQSVPTVEIGNLTVETAKTLLTTEEKEEVNNGATIKVYIDIVNNETTIAKDEKSKIEAEAKKLSATMDHVVYLDLSLFMKLSTEEKAVRITDTNGQMLAVSIDLPETLINTEAGTTRKYYIVRVHEGVSEILPAVYKVIIKYVVYDEETQTLTFETDKFSSYAIIYADQKSGSADIQTGDHNNTWMWYVLMFSGMGVAMSMNLYRKKRVTR